MLDYLFFIIELIENQKLTIINLFKLPEICSSAPNP